MIQPFNKQHIRYFFLFYGAVVLIMVLFYFAGTRFLDIRQYDKKAFPQDANASARTYEKSATVMETAPVPAGFRLLPSER